MGRDQLPGPVLFDRGDNGASPVYLIIHGPVYVVHGPVAAIVCLSIDWLGPFCGPLGVLYSQNCPTLVVLLQTSETQAK